MRLTAALLLAAASLAAKSAVRVEVSWKGARDGRVLLILAHRDHPEPRFQLSEDLLTQQVFGVDAAHTESVAIDSDAPGYPMPSLDQIPAGEYFVQAVLNVYETFHLADGRVLQLPMDQGEGQQWNRKPGNLFSDPVRVRINPQSSTPVRLVLGRTIPPIDPPQDTRYVRHVRLQSKLLSEFWGRPMYLGASVVVPEGFDEHPDARYPVLYYQGHFARTFLAFRNQTPPSVARMLIVQTQDPNPYGDNSYAVNSVNLGPYGDALIQELYPYIERQFRALAQPWARCVYGGSTGGWRALALQLFHPDFFNGAWIVSPDPVDFSALALIDLYRDSNAFHSSGEWKNVPVTMIRDAEGRIQATMEDGIRYERVIASRGRSAEQWDLWQAVFSPAGNGGYPAPIFDGSTGVIDHAVAEYWKRNYDLVEFMRRNWPALGPRLAGKLHFTAGITDAFFLERSVHSAERFLRAASEPRSDAEFEYSAAAGHGSAVGAPPPAVSLHQRVMSALLERIGKTAPAGADLTSWK